MKHIVTGLKLVVAIGALGWLVNNGLLDFGVVTRLFMDLNFLGVTLLFWLVGPVIFSSTKWLFILSSVEHKFAFFDVFKAHMVGLFLNTVMPGAFGGDLAKIFYLPSERSAKNLAILTSTILMDRVLGLIALIFIAVPGCVWFLATSGGEGFLYWFLPLSIVGAVSLVAVLVGLRYSSAGLKHLMQKVAFRLPVAKSTANSLIEVLSQIANTGRKEILYSFLFSLLTHLVTIAYFMFLVQFVAGNEIGFLAMSVIFMVTGIAISLPISPGGIGVGHGAFAALFGVFSVSSGADIFNLFLITQIALNVTGVIPMLMSRKAKCKIEDEPTALAA